MSSRDWEGAGAVAGAGVAAAIVIAIILIWLAIKIIELVARTLIAHPHNLPLRVALAVFGAALLVGSFTAWESIVVNSLVGVSLLALVMMCKILEVYYAPVLETEWDRDAVAQAVLHEPWWQVAA